MARDIAERPAPPPAGADRAAGVTARDIVAGLRALGVRRDGVLLVHSSLSSLGHVEGGADTVVDALQEALGPGGTLALPAFTYASEGSPPYDPACSRARTGAIPECFRRRPGVRRSVHPTHSIAAIGPRAGRILDGYTPAEFPFGRHSPFEALFRLDADVLFLGCSMAPNTTLHAVEAWCGLPYLVDWPMRAVRLDDAGQPETITIPGNPGGHRGFYRPDAEIARAFEAAGIVHAGRVGAAASQRVRMQAMVRLALDRLEADPSCLLCRQPDCAFCHKHRAANEAQRDRLASRVREARAWLWNATP